ncbi:MAG: orotidine-5'-phosphate decarboxylase [Elainella sp. Prado103]|jgi:orotidine-5'-phosphate decarboxylase|nr:orotidine-5'-phosphate decarboxylase [Elainella sp. Prado103]
MTPAERIIVPLDLPDETTAITLLDRLPEVQFWKVGLELFVATGGRILELLKARQKRIFLDLKFHDIPNTMAGACRSATRYGVDLLTVHAAAGQAALQAAQAAAQAEAEAMGITPPRLIAVTILTSLSPTALTTELQVATPLPDYACHLAKLAQQSGLSGVVCSPQEATQLRQTCGDRFLLVCPGVRPSGTATGDQQRSMTPTAARQAGADYLVIGRPITTAPDPAAVFAQIVAELTS